VLIAVCSGWDVATRSFYNLKASKANVVALSLDGTAVTSTAAELNALDGITSTVTELNKLDGFTGTAVQLNAAVAAAGSVTGVFTEVYCAGALTTETATATSVTIPEGGLTDSTVLSADIKDGEVVNADVNASAAIALTKLASSGLGTALAGTASGSEAVSDIVVTTVTFTNVVLTATDGSDEGESQKVFDCDDGAFTLLTAVANAQSVVSPGATNTYVMALGTVAAADDSALTSTEVDVIPSTSIDTTAGTVLTNAFDAVLAAPANFDGTGTAKDIYLNFAIDDDNMNANVTNTVTGTLTVFSTKATDN